MQADATSTDRLPLIESVLKNLSQLGKADPSPRMLESISRVMDVIVRLTSAEPLLGEDQTEDTSSAIRPNSTKVTRAPRGSVGEFVLKTLLAAPGLTQRELESAAEDTGGEISALSIGNELRRFERGKYIKDEQKRWYVISRDSTAVWDRARPSQNATNSPSEGDPESWAEAVGLLLASGRLDPDQVRLLDLILKGGRRQPFRGDSQS